MRLLLVLCCIFFTVQACVDILIAVDPKDEIQIALSRASGVITSINNSDIKMAMAVHRDNMYTARRIKNKKSFLSEKEFITGDMNQLIGVVTLEVSRRVKIRRALIALVFSEKDIDPRVLENWKKIQRSELHVFRVGSVKKTTDIFEKSGKTFEDLVSCSSDDKLQILDREIRRKPVKENSTTEKPITTTRRPATTRRFSPTTRKTTTRSDVTKAHPVFRGRNAAALVPAAVPRITTIPPTIRSITHLPKVTKPSAFRFPITTKKPAATTSQPSTTTKKVPQGCVVDLMFLVDLSRGTGDNSKKYFDVAATAIGSLPISQGAVRVGMIGYSGRSRANLLFQLNKHDNKDDLIEEMFRMESTGGTTRTGEAIHFAIKEIQNEKHGARKWAKKVIVVLTDGFSQDDPYDASDIARQEGIQLIAVAVNGNPIEPNMDELIDIASKKELVFVSPQGRQLRDGIIGNGCPM